MTGRASDAQVARRQAIIAAIVSGATYASIARQWGIGVKGAQHYARYLSAAEHEQRKRAKGSRPRRGSSPRRDAIVAAILRGDRFSDIGKRFGILENGARGYLRHLSDAQRAERKMIERARHPRRSDTTPRVPFRPIRDDAYAKMATAMPHWLSDASRDDALSDLYVAHLEGRLTDDIAGEAKRYASRTVAAFESKFGPRSLDERLFDDSAMTFGETLVDPAALEAFDYIFEEAR
ncbi:MAG TPA: hypothetical protein VN047_05810 [Sphingopyxis sp.]|uniref:hypothetical protein n=1 Tax=Sphingopyxis sp. TaxID=1908224 RepID=UPI002C7EEE18|nr:hypothetical protein [Sphingopyxis sp.]HWW56387.1 hypothetical protein [Sphingopyxis sp.]